MTTVEAMLDVSELLRPEPAFATKPVVQFRDYTVDPSDRIKERVRRLYHDMHTNMTVDFVRERRAHWLRFDKFRATMMEAVTKMAGFLDESDPDVDVPNIVHGFQTAEAIRREHPDKGWFQLAGLIHDVGKVLHLYGEPQWATTGDTFPVGCAWAPSVVYRDTSFADNPDGKHPVYSTQYGMYEPHCGLEHVLMSWGHDEYIYQVLKHNKTTLPDEALYMVRFHSFYPWHSSGDYMHLCNEKDKKMLRWVLKFNEYDLYTKTDDDLPDIETLKPYYENLIDQYIPGVLEW